MKAKIIPQEDKDVMVAAYNRGLSSRDAAALISCDHSTCLNELRRRGLKARSLPEAERKYAVDEHVFDDIDTEEKAYWLGFITGDGNISQNHLILHLAECDKEQLEKFKRFMKSEHPISLCSTAAAGKQHRSCRIDICCKYLVESLFKHGITKQKSLTVKICPSVPPQYMADYFRGLVDADGWICLDKRSRWRIGLCGNKNVVHGFSNWIKSFLITRTGVKPQGKIFRVVYYSNILTPTIISALYRDATTYLDRKMELAKQAIAIKTLA